MRPHRSQRRGFLLLDVLLALVVVAIIAAVAVPALRPNDSLKLISAATLLTTDLEFAQSATLDSPADATILRVDAEESRYWLALASDPDEPIVRPSGGGAYEVRFGQGRHQYLTDVGLTLENGQNGAVVFDAFGRLTQTTDARIILNSPTGSLAVRVTASTGSVRIGQ